MAETIESGLGHLLVFTLDEPRYALPLAAVERIVRAVEITPLPKAPRIVLGVINVEGGVIPVVDVRRRFGLPERELRLEDRFIIARAGRRLVALVADEVAGVRACAPRALVSAAQSLPFAAYLQGVAKLEDGLALISDLEAFLSLEEEQLLDTALAGDPA